MIRKVYMIEAIDTEEYELAFRIYARNLKTAEKIRRRGEKWGYEVSIYDCTRDYKNGLPIRREWIEG